MMGVFRNSLIVAVVSIGCCTSFANNSDFVGHWTAVDGDKSWARIDIDKDMLVTAYRTCAGQAASSCDQKSHFQLTTYGKQSDSIPRKEDVGSGHVVDDTYHFKATEIFEIRDRQLFVREYVDFSSMPGSKDMLMKTTLVQE
jgi:hypothetical protein